LIVLSEAGSCANCLTEDTIGNYFVAIRLCKPGGSASAGTSGEMPPKFSVTILKNPVDICINVETDGPVGNEIW
jgi:hypothetical protein